jgi:hypothetical protein
MADKAPENQIKTINFDGLQYNIEDLTPRTADGFNSLVRIQQEINELAYQLKVKQAAQVQFSSELKNALKEDKVKGIEVEVEKKEEKED